MTSKPIGSALFYYPLPVSGTRSLGIEGTSQASRRDGFIPACGFG